MGSSWFWGVAGRISFRRPRLFSFSLHVLILPLSSCVCPTHGFPCPTQTRQCQLYCVSHLPDARLRHCKRIAQAISLCASQEHVVAQGSAWDDAACLFSVRDTPRHDTAGLVGHVLGHATASFWRIARAVCRMYLSEAHFSGSGVQVKDLELPTQTSRACVS